MGRMVLNLNYTFTGWEQHDNQKCAVLEYVGDVSMKSAGDGDAAGMMSIDQGKASGKTWFDPAMGMIKETAGKQDLTMKINAQGQSISTQMQQNPWTRNSSKSLTLRNRRESSLQRTGDGRGRRKNSRGGTCNSEFRVHFMPTAKPSELLKPATYHQPKQQRKTMALNNAPDLTQRPPRSPRVRLGGYVILPRMLDKGRATINGKTASIIIIVQWTRGF